MINLGDKIYVKGNIGIVSGKDSIAYLVEYYGKSSEGNTKFIRQWYSNEIVLNYFEDDTERDIYFVSNPSSLIEEILIFVKDLGAYKYINSVWVKVNDTSVGDIVISDGISEILTARNSTIYSKKFTTVDERIEFVESKIEDKTSNEDFTIFKESTDSQLANNMQQTTDRLALKRDKTTAIKSTELDISTQGNKIQPINISDTLMAMFSPAGTVSPVIPSYGVTKDKIAPQSVDFTKCDFITNSVGVNLFTVYKTMAVGVDYEILTVGKSATFLVTPNERYHIKITGAHDRFRIVGTVLTTTGQTVWDENIFINDTINGDYELDILPKISNMIIIYVSNSGQAPTLLVTRNKIELVDFLFDGDDIKPISIPEGKLAPKSVGVIECNFVSNIDNDNLFINYSNTDIIVSNNFITRTSLLTIEQVNTAIVDIVPHTKYKIKIEGGIGDKWRIAMMNEKIDLATIPYFESGNVNSYILADVVCINNDVYQEINIDNIDGVQLFIYASGSNQKPNLVVQDRSVLLEFNGLIKSTSLEQIEQYNPTFLNSISEYSSPNLPSVANGQPFYLGGSMAQDIYDMFDGLMASNPNYITKTLIGNEATSNLPIYQYDFMPQVVTGERDVPKIVNVKLPKILIGGCIHGEEKQAAWSIIKFLEDMCNNWELNSTLEFFRNNVNFKIIPVVNPWGYNTNVRHNGTGLDLNREFSKPVETMAIESQIYKNFIDENIDADFFIDCHTMWAGYNRNIAWIISPDGYLNQLSNSVICKLSQKWKKQYDFITYDGILGYIGDPDYTIKGGMSSMVVVYAYIQGLKKSICIECANHVNYPIEPLRYGALTTNMYVDLLGNFLVASAVKLGVSFK